MIRFLLVALLAGTLSAPAFAQFTVASEVSAEATAANSQPKLARGADGTIYLTFVKPAGGIAQIFVASSPDGGRTWRLHQATTGTVDSRFPSLAVGPDGHAHLVWTQYDGGIGKVYSAQFDGITWTAPVRLSPGDAYAGIPALAVDAQRRVHLVWYGIRAQAPAVRTRHGSIYEILYTQFAGGRWSVPEVISPGIPDSINPTLATDASSVLHSAWYQFDARAYQVRHTEHTQAWRHPEQVSTGGEDAFAVAMAVGTDGAVYLVWERRESTGSRIYFAARGPSAHLGPDRRWSAQQPLSPALQQAHNPTIAVDSRHRVYVVWDRDGQLQLRRKDARWQDVETLAIDGRNTGPIIAARGDTVDLMWTQQIGTQVRLRFATIAGAPSPAGSGSRSLWGVLILAVILLVAVWQWQRARRMSRAA